MKKQFNFYYIAFFYLCTNFAVFAIPGAGNDSSDLESIDAPAAPINDYLWVLVLIGLILVFLQLKSYSRKNDSNSNN